VTSLREAVSPSTGGIALQLLPKRPVPKASSIYTYCKAVKNLGMFKGIVSRYFGSLFLFHWIDLKVVI
jgi:hypothetical protein